MLTAYFDESYNHRLDWRPNEPLFFTVGCWLSTVEQWKKFGKLWKSALRSAQIDYFHMTDYESRQREYEDWSELKRVGVLKNLHRIIKRHKIYGCSITVSREAFDKLIKPHPKLKKYFGGSYYGFDVQVAIMAINDWCDKNDYPGPIEYFFADWAKQGGVLDPMFRTLLKKPELRKKYRLSGSWTKGLMKDVPQLQAADIIAYEANKRAINHIGESEDYIRKSLQNLHLDYDFDPLYFGEHEIARWIKRDGLEHLLTPNITKRGP